MTGTPPTVGTAVTFGTTGTADDDGTFYGVDNNLKFCQVADDVAVMVWFNTWPDTSQIEARAVRWKDTLVPELGPAYALPVDTYSLSGLRGIEHLGDGVVLVPTVNIYVTGAPLALALRVNPSTLAITKVGEVASPEGTSYRHAATSTSHGNRATLLHRDYLPKTWLTAVTWNGTAIASTTWEVTGADWALYTDGGTCDIHDTGSTLVRFKQTAHPSLSPLYTYPWAGTAALTGPGTATGLSVGGAGGDMYVVEMPDGTWHLSGTEVGGNFEGATWVVHPSAWTATGPVLSYPNGGVYRPQNRGDHKDSDLLGTESVHLALGYDIDKNVVLQTFDGTAFSTAVPIFTSFSLTQDDLWYACGIAHLGGGRVVSVFAGNNWNTAGDHLDAAEQGWVALAQYVGVAGGGDEDDDLVLGPPDAPHLDLLVAGDGSMQAQWTPPVYNGGAEIRVWEVVANGVVYRVDNPLAITGNMTGLENGTEYTVIVRAINDQGTSPDSNALAATPLAGLAVYGAETLAVTMGAPVRPRIKPPPIYAFFPKGVNNSQGYFSPRNWAGR